VQRFARIAQQISNVLAMLQMAASGVAAKGQQQGPNKHWT
jgi:hypothetical protein